ncbi:membrane protein [Achlya hypogyna]|uniref:rhomboid protease n=1 Tax=Achlya hypogyna TaxID=1202772 RepID=A0A1V9YNA8_ACHHY|nr:membrane protein [Achlya hypogyna]
MASSPAQHKMRMSHSPARSPRNDADEREERIVVDDGVYSVPPGDTAARIIVPNPSSAPAGKPKLVPQFKFILTMIALNTIIFVIEIGKNGWTVESLKVNPLIGPSSGGAQRTDLIKDDGEWWRLLTAMFLHAGVVHLLFNMAALYQLGMELESTFDRRRIAFIYFATGLIGAIVSGFFVPDVVGVGASGAIFGLFGATFAEFMLNWKLYTNRVCHMTNLIVVAVINLGIGLLPFVNNFAHLSGFISGLGLGFALLSLPLSRQDRIMGTRTRKQRLLGWSGAAFTIVFAVLFIALFASETDAKTACPWCKYLDCVPAPWWSCDATSGECYGEQFKNGTLVVTCPSGKNLTAPPNSAFTAALCTSLCT